LPDALAIVGFLQFKCVRVKGVVFEQPAQAVGLKLIEYLLLLVRYYPVR
jgi:hypothetical protein